MRPPAAARLVPPRSAVGMLARFAFWPLAFVGARALQAGDARLVAGAQRQGELGVISAARMDPAFPWLTTQRYAPRRPACSFDLRARLYKMITRSLLLSACHAAPRRDDHSVLRPSVMSLSDLDAIEEDVF